MLPLVELRLDSFIYKQQPTLSRSSYSHVDNDGVKALVDSICNRGCAMAAGERSMTRSKPNCFVLLICPVLPCFCGTSDLVPTVFPMHGLTLQTCSH